MINLDQSLTFASPILQQSLYPSSSPQSFHSSHNLSPFFTFTSYEPVAIQSFLGLYKTTPCGNSMCGGGAQCPYFHHLGDRRRPLFCGGKLAYSAAICPHMLRNFYCPKGDQCTYSHNNNESLYHPANYKASLCSQEQLCLREFCPWAHFHEELRNPSITQGYVADEPMDYPKERPALDAELETFKSKACTLQTQHNQKRCPFFHSAKDKRRPPGSYSAELCEAGDRGGCPLKDLCKKSHSMVERLYHPDKYKTKYCNNYPNALQNCEYSSYCCFAHSNQELRVELIHYYEKDEDFYLFHFKTGWCPFNYEHNKAMCVYAHNWQDFRRKPHLFHYSNQMCPNWKSETFIVEYKEGCVFEHKCGHCHGWKEQFYHPLNYKTMPCPDIKKCLRSLECPYFHSEADRRCPLMPMKLYPRPRDYKQNPVLTLSNNINIQREQELKNELCNSSGKEIARRFSEELHHKSLGTSSKHRVSYDFTHQVRRMSTMTSLVNIREESPEHGKDLFEIFQPQEDAKESISLFFSPVSVKKAREGHKSCPDTPLVGEKNFKRFSIFEQLRLNEAEETKEVEEFLLSAGLQAFAQEFLNRKLTLNDIVGMSQDDFKEMGIQEDKIKLIMAKIREHSELNFEKADTISDIVGEEKFILQK